MPDLDVSDVLSDPDFCETIAVTRQTQMAVVDHQPQFATAQFTITAVVQPANSKDLQRMLDAERNGGGVTIYAAVTPVMRVAGSLPLINEDVVSWQGDEYTVIGMDDWSRFGGGYVRAVAAKSNLP